MKVRFERFLFAGASVFALATAAHAQEATSDDVVVTGSRTIRNGDSSPSPVTVVQTQEILRVQPGTLSDALNLLPVFAGSRSPSANPSSNGSLTGGNGSSNQLNLRNLGVTRTLVLMDGYRVPPTSFNNVVDVDLIPSMLIQRVDTVTGGVSAVYGSDAVAGVVNYVIDRKFNGVKAQATWGESSRKDNGKIELGIAGGMNLANDRAHLEASYEYFDNDGVGARSDRPWLNQWGVGGAGTAANPYTLFSDLRQANVPFGGLVTSGATAPLNNYTFGTDGVLRPFVAGAATGTTNLQVGGDGGYLDSSLVATLKANQYFGRFDYDLSDSVRFYVQIAGETKTNENWSDPARLSNVTLFTSNAFLPNAYRTQVGTPGATTFRFSKLFDNASRLHAVADSTQMVYTTGLDGKFGDYDWGVNYNHGDAQIDTALVNNVNNQRVAAALDAVVDPSSGKIVCNLTLTNPTLAQGCVPLNPFGPTAVTADMLGYILQPTYYTGNTLMDDVAGHISGSPFALPAGPVTVALSTEWRKLSFRESTTGSPQDLVNCTGIRNNCTTGGALWAFSFANEQKVSQTVAEAAIEADVPLIKDAPLIQSFSVNGAARYTRYDTSGAYTTWKVGGDWHLNDQLRFRATKSRDIRAPTLYELFAPVNSVPVTATDLLTGASPSVPSTDLSNPALKAEIADTITGGMVWRPFSVLSFTLDGYKITINDAVTQAAGSNPAYQQLCYASGGTSEWCALQQRPGNNFTSTAAANAVTGWYTKYLNLSQIETEGADLEVNYTPTLFNHPASFRLLTAYQPHAYYRQPGVPTIDQGGVGFGPTGYSAGATWRVVGFVRFQPIDKFTVDVMERWRSGMKLGGDPSLIWSDNHMDSFATTNLTLTYDVSDHMAGFVNVVNLFDTATPGGGYSGNGTRAGLRDGFAPGDDPTGLNFAVGVRLKY